MTGAANLHKSDFNGNTREQTFSRIVAALGIDGINLPVLLLDGDVRVRSANAKARKLLSREQSEINGFQLGEVIGCAHAPEARQLRGDSPLCELRDEAGLYLYDGHG
jgi:hypothetical protein